MTMNMIDLHCHLLYGMDDGAKTIEDTLALCRSAVQNDIKAIIATPHFNDYFNIGKFAEVREDRISVIETFLAEQDIDLGIGSGAEVFLNDDIFSVEDLSPLCINGSRYLLCEYHLLPFEPKYAGIYAERIVSLGLVPIIAHPERYLTFLDNPWIVDDLADMGTLFQVNAASLAGKGGERVQSFATDMVLTGKASFIGTDAHSAVSRSNDFKDCAAAFNERIGIETVKKLVYKNPLKVITNKEI